MYLMKKRYVKPTVEEVLIDCCHIICASQLESVNLTGMDDEHDNIDISDEDAGNGFWGR